MSIYPVQTIDRYWLLILLAGAVFFALSLLLPKHAFALENPHLYYDWNNYYAPSEQVLGIEAFAQEGTDSATPTDQPATPTAPTAPDYHDYKNYTGYVLGFTADLNPDDPFYFLKRVQENVAVTFTFDPKVREETRFAIAGERLAEMETMTQEGKADLVSSLANDYNTTMKAIADNLTTLKDQGQDVTPLLAATDVEAAKHTLVLEEVSLQVPPQAEKGIAIALAASEKVVDTVADIAGRPAVPPEMVTRLQSLKAQGLLTEEEVTKLIAVDSRISARDEFRKLTEARVFPASDFRKLDEAARSYFPQGYATVIEYRKFQELKDLETQKPDAATLTQLQGFADAYKAGDIVPSELRRWWVPMIRLEELQNTFRPDLISQDFFRYRPDDQQKYTELVERVKPRAEDIAYVNRLAATNPDVLNDPAYARIRALADRFGSSEQVGYTPPPQAASCSRDSHWIPVGFMPGGGYCVPNLVYSPTDFVGTGGAQAACTPGYHRNDPLGPCFPDNPFGPGAGPSILRASTSSCGTGYHFVSLPQSGGYCAPDSPTIGGGGYPGPITPPSYCPAGQMFIDGKCETYNSPPTEGCPSRQFWSGTRCVEVKQCPAGQYQNASGDCVATGGIGERTCQPPASGCPVGWFDYTSCSCNTTTPGGHYTTPPYGTPATFCPQGQYVGPGGYCVTNYGPPSYGTPSSSCPSGQFIGPGGYCISGGPYGTPGVDTHYCGDGYYWNGSYCAPTSGGGTYGTPSGTYGTPATSCPAGQYIGPGGYCISSTYGSPSGTYGTPSGTYGTPSYYGTPSGSYPTPYYGTPSGGYATPPPYGTPSYGTPSGSYGTPTP